MRVIIFKDQDLISALGCTDLHRLKIKTDIEIRTKIVWIASNSLIKLFWALFLVLYEQKYLVCFRNNCLKQNLINENLLSINRAVRGFYLSLLRVISIYEL